MPEGQILQILRTYFTDILVATPDLVNHSHQLGVREFPIDYFASTQNNAKPFYISIRQNAEISQDETKVFINNLYALTNRQIIGQAPLIVVVPRREELLFGILLYWDYDKCYNNQNINWRPLNADTARWLELQLQAHRQRIAQLPEDYLRIVKTINLNCKELVEPEIIYLRKFSNIYHMSTPPILTEQERFNRLLSGTPENEYPNDNLDKLLINHIRTQYPEATVKSSILLFDVDLIKFRQKKDKRIYSQTIHMLPIRYDHNGQIIGQAIGELSVVIEYYYYPNVFRQFGLRPLSEIVEIDEQMAQEYQSLLTTYEPFSAINI